jgi:trk system potassium uptake protein TrkH
VVAALILAALGLDTETSLSAAATAIANVGPGVGPLVGPAGNFSTLPDAAKLVLCAAMIVGRLEILGILVLFLPSFYR